MAAIVHVLTATVWRHARECGARDAVFAVPAGDITPAIYETGVAAIRIIEHMPYTTDGRRHRCPVHGTVDQCYVAVVRKVGELSTANDSDDSDDSDNSV